MLGQAADGQTCQFCGARLFFRGQTSCQACGKSLPSKAAAADPAGPDSGSTPATPESAAAAPAPSPAPATSPTPAPSPATAAAPGTAQTPPAGGSFVWPASITPAAAPGGAFSWPTAATPAATPTPAPAATPALAPAPAPEATPAAPRRHFQSFSLPAPTALAGSSSLADGSAPAAAATQAWQASPVSNAPTTDGTAPIRGNDQAAPSAKSWSPAGFDGPAAPNSAPAQSRHGPGTRRAANQPPAAPPPYAQPPATPPYAQPYAQPPAAPPYAQPYAAPGTTPQPRPNAAGWGQPQAPNQTAGSTPPPFGGRTWDSRSGTWWPAQPQGRRARRSGSGISTNWIIFGVIAVFAVIFFASAANQSSNNDGGYVPNDGLPIMETTPYPWDATDTPVAVTPSPTAPVSLSLTTTGSLQAARAFQTATLLQDGRVLVAGGEDGAGKALGSAELFDPTTNSSVPTGSMSTARLHGTATRLSDTLVLIAGGQDASGKALATAEIFDENAGTFEATAGSMSTPRVNATAVALRDGRVLIVGGSDGKKPLDTAEIYDTASDRFSVAGSMSVPREGATAVVLGGTQLGQVLVSGGIGPSGPLDTSEIWDFATNAFGPPENLGLAKQGATACPLPDGGVLLVGGHGSDSAADNGTLKFWVDQNAWTLGPTIEPGGTVAAAITLTDGSILIVEGVSIVGQPSDVIDIYDPTAAAVGHVGSLTQPRTNLTVTQLSDGSIMVAGGQDAGGSAVATVEIYRLSH